VKIKKDGVLTDLGGKFEFISNVMEPNSTYVFTVVVTKDSRQHEASHTLKVANSEPPPVLIE